MIFFFTVGDEKIANKFPSGFCRCVPSHLVLKRLQISLMTCFWYMNIGASKNSLNGSVFYTFVYMIRALKTTDQFNAGDMAEKFDFMKIRLSVKNI